MTDSDTGVPAVNGLAVEDAVDVVVPSVEADRETVRAALDGIATDGVVGRDGFDDRVAGASKVLATAETRAELAEGALADARDHADPVADVPVVSFRLDRFGDRLDEVTDDAADLGARLDDAIDRADESLYEAAVGVERVEATAHDVQQRADELQMDLEDFERWLDSAEMRHDHLEEDAAALDASISDISDAVDRLATAAADGDAAGDADEASDLAVAWADARFRVEMLSLLVADVRAELDDLRTLAEREGADQPTGLDDRLDSLVTRCGVLDDRLADLATPAWRERFGDDVDAFAGELAAFEPPIRWEAVYEQLETYRSRIGATA